MLFFKIVTLLLLFTLSLLGKPTANAGNPQSTNAASAYLDGSGSSDDVDEYLWEITEKPDASNPQLENETTVKPKIINMDKDGKYTIKLTVKDTNIYYSNTDTDTVTVEVTPLNYINIYSCGIFDYGLISYTSIKAKNTTIFGTTTIAYPKNKLDGEINCNVNNKTETCYRGETPANKFYYPIYVTSKLTTDEAKPSSSLTALEYGNFKGDLDLILEASQTYKNSTEKKVMLLGDIVLTGENNKISFTKGDYFFNSLTLKENNESLVIDDEVRIFIKNNFDAQYNALINKENDSSKLFLYIGGDLTANKKSFVNGFAYVRGDVLLKESSEFHGSLSIEGKITIEEDAEFHQDSSIEAIGYSECAICYLKDNDDDDDTTLTPIINIRTTDINNLFITEITSENTSDNGWGNDDDVPTILDQGKIKIKDASVDNDIYTYDFGSNYKYSGEAKDIFYQTSRNSDKDDEDKVIHKSSYTDASGKNYNIVTSICKASTSGTNSDGEYIVGTFDAWMKRDDDDTAPPEINDRNITTQIINKEFSLSLASLNHQDEYDYKKNSDEEKDTGIIEVAIYKNGTSQKISNTVKFQIPEDTNDRGKQHIDTTFVVDSIERNATVVMKICATLKQNKDLSSENVVNTIQGNGNIYEIFPFEDCDHNKLDKCDKETEDEPSFHMCGVSDPFSIRPAKFIISTPSELLISAKDKNISIDTTDLNDAVITTYNISNNDYNMSNSLTKYMPDDTINNTLHGTATISKFNFINGKSSDMQISFDDVAKIQIQIEDQEWTAIDRGDGTSENCLNGGTIGRYICGETNATFIPSHFSFSDLTLFDHDKNKTYTYISDDTNISLMSAHIGVTITAQNDKNNTTKNFDTNSWENEVAISFVTGDETNISKNEILKTQLNFDKGVRKIVWNDANNSANLLFNYKRDDNNALNPFRLEGSDINISLVSNYTGIDIEDNNGKIIVGDGNATFVYARTNIPRSRFVENDKYKLNLYYEVFCAEKEDSRNNSCKEEDKKLLPNGSSSSTTDDPRWFVNSLHKSHYGTAHTITQKRGTSISVDSSPTGNHQDSVTLLYSGKFPYKTTMQNKASSWLIYRKYGKTTHQHNEFEIEFSKKSGTNSWAGVSEDDVASTRGTVDTTTRTNRRSMW